MTAEGQPTDSDDSLKPRLIRDGYIALPRNSNSVFLRTKSSICFLRFEQIASKTYANMKDGYDNIISIDVLHDFRALAVFRII